MIRIVQVLEATTGGTRKHLRLLAESLDAEEFDVRIVCAVKRDPESCEDIEIFERLGHRVHLLSMTRGLDPFHDFLGIVRMRRLLRAESCDILHLHSAKAGALGRLAAWNLPCKVIYTPHAFPFLQRTPRPLRALYAFAERMLAPRTDLLLAVGEEEGRIAENTHWYAPTGVLVLRNAIDVPAVAAEVARQPRIDVPPNAAVVGFLGDLRAQKDPMTLIDAAEIVCARASGVHFVLPRWGRLLSAVERRIRKRKLGLRVHLVPRSGPLLPYYCRMDLGVLPSLWEALPYALLEALALGIPVIAANIPPVARILEKVSSELLFEAGRPHELAERIEAGLQLTAADRERMAKRALALVQEEHAIEPWRQSIRRIYRELIEVPALRATS